MTASQAIAPTPAKRSKSEGPGKSERTRSSLLDAAAKVLVERGYSHTRLSDIVETVGIHPASIYYHFSSKDALVEEVLAIAMASSMRFVRTAVAELPNDALAIDRIVTAAAAHLHIVFELGDYIGAALRILGEVPRSRYEAFMADRLVYARYWEALLADAERDGEIEAGLNIPVLRALLIAAMGWRLDWHIDCPPTAEAVTDTVLLSFVMGVATPKSRGRMMDVSRTLSRKAVAATAAGFER